MRRRPALFLANAAGQGFGGVGRRFAAGEDAPKRRVALSDDNLSRST